MLAGGTAVAAELRRGVFSRGCGGGEESLESIVRNGRSTVALAVVDGRRGHDQAHGQGLKHYRSRSRGLRGHWRREGRVSTATEGAVAGGVSLERRGDLTICCEHIRGQRLRRHGRRDGAEIGSRGCVATTDGGHMSDSAED